MSDIETERSSDSERSTTTRRFLYMAVDYPLADGVKEGRRAVRLPAALPVAVDRPLVANKADEKRLRKKLHVPKPCARVVLDGPVEMARSSLAAALHQADKEKATWLEGKVNRLRELFWNGTGGDDLNAFEPAAGAGGGGSKTDEEDPTAARDQRTARQIHDIKKKRFKLFVTRQAVADADGSFFGETARVAAAAASVPGEGTPADLNRNKVTDTPNHASLSSAALQAATAVFSQPIEASAWLSQLGNDACRNPALNYFFEKQFDYAPMEARLLLFIDRLATDRDRVRVHGQYYNNVYLGKRMFGPSRKQRFQRTIIGGMERRFEILDGQVNHIPMTHLASDRSPGKCRNTNVRCRDSTRVVLRWPAATDGSDVRDDLMHSGTTGSSASTDLAASFIHANWVRGAALFNSFILTQAPMDSTIDDFWRMIWQERAAYIFMLVARRDTSRCARYWPRNTSEPPLRLVGGRLRVECAGVDVRRDAKFRVTYLRVVDEKLEGANRELRVEHWQHDANDSDDVTTALRLLRLARNSARPTVVHCHLGISRSACLVAAEAAICSLLRGPTLRHTVQQAVHWLRGQRAHAIETPMQYIYVHRVVVEWARQLAGEPSGLASDYARWMENRAGRCFLDEFDAPVPGYRLLSPRVDPDLIAQVHDGVGEMPLPLDAPDVLRPMRRLPNKYPTGARYC